MYSALFASFWVLGGAIVAMSNTRFHGVFAVWLFIPSAFIIIPWLGYDHGIWASILALIAVGSMLRWPLYYVGKYLQSKVTGQDFSWPDWRPNKSDKG
tara:strand:- start:5460 stop:5753 length:294 start_codon:yes stop_codon:yes gene_type:complete